MAKFAGIVAALLSLLIIEAGRLDNLVIVRLLEWDMSLDLKFEVEGLVMVVLFDERHIKLLAELTSIR